MLPLHSPLHSLPSRQIKVALYFTVTINTFTWAVGPFGLGGVSPFQPPSCTDDGECSSAAGRDCPADCPVSMKPHEPLNLGYPFDVLICMNSKTSFGEIWVMGCSPSGHVESKPSRRTFGGSIDLVSCSCVVFSETWELTLKMGFPKLLIFLKKKKIDQKTIWLTSRYVYHWRKLDDLQRFNVTFAHSNWKQTAVVWRVSSLWALIE